MKFESVISETKAKREQVWLAYDYNGDQLQLEAKWLDDGIRRLPADDVFLIRVVSICDGCPILLTQAFDSIRHVYLRVITICMLSIITHETLPPPPPHPARLWACRWKPQMTSESADLTHGFTVASFDNVEVDILFLTNSSPKRNVLDWIRERHVMQDGTDFKGLLISFKMFLDLTPCYYSSTTDHDGWMMDIILCLTLMFLYDHQTNRRFDLIWWASWDCWGSMIWYEREKTLHQHFPVPHHHDWGTPEQGLNLQCVLHLYSHSCRGVNVQNCPLKIKEHFHKFQLVKNPMFRQG